MEILSQSDGRVLIVKINRPEAMNSLNPSANELLLQTWERFESDDALHVAVLTGVGSKSFSAGADLKTMIPAMRDRVNSGEEGVEWNFGGGLARGFTFTKPLICAINGHCHAGGMEMALACDIRLASPNAMFSLAEVKWAVMPGAGGTQRLPRAIPLGMAMEILLTGDAIDANTALRTGLVNHIYPQDQLLDEAVAVAHRIASRGPLAIRAVKQAVLAGFDHGFTEGMAREHEAFLKVMRSADSEEGYRAFSEKRSPNYEGH